VTIGIVRQVAVTGRAVNLLVCPCWGSLKMPSSDSEKPVASFCLAAGNGSGEAAKRTSGLPGVIAGLSAICPK
jgi:hypothetical protein